MKAETTKRLFRAIADRSWPNVDAVVRQVVVEERRLGHAQLATQLQALSERAVSPSAGHELVPLPSRSKNGAVGLVEEREPSQLRHHMVLRPDIESRLRRIEQEFAARDRLSRFGLRPRSRVLLFGAPGCGKSLAAERLAANIGVPLFKVQFDALMSSLFGESATNLRAVFDLAKRRPCLLLMDECDFVAKSRLATNDVGEVPRIVNTFLQMMEEYSGPGIIVATTNIRDSLDSAVFRRFDDAIEIPSPELDQVVALLQMALSAMNVSPNVKWDDISHRLVGHSAAEIVRFAEDAAKDAVLQGARIVEQSNFDRIVVDTL